MLRPVVSAVPLCPRWIFIVPLYPRAWYVPFNMSAVPLCPQIILEIHYILNTRPLKLKHSTWFIKIKYGLDVYMTNF